jgi:putative transposase
MGELIGAGREPRPQLSIAHLCQTLSVSRAAYYRWQSPGAVTNPDMAVRDQIQHIALERPAYGYRRITHELQRGGIAVNHKRGLRLMRADNLLCLRTRGVIRTTNSQHHLVVYPHVLPELAVNGLDQLWVADITDVRLQREFVDLAVRLDAYSRRGIGWELAHALEVELALVA